MTNEEAINELLQCYSLYSPFKTAKKTNEAISMAIAALKGKDTNVGDMISRQAAIDLLKQMRKDGDMVPWEGKDVFARIRKLPSAQPETCEGCKHLGKWENEVEYGYPSPCTCCKRRVEDHYER